MKLQKQMVYKIATGLVLVLLAGIVTFLIKEVLSARNPESALPEIRIDYIEVELPAEHWMRDSYSWKFLFMTRKWEEEDRDKWRNMAAAPVLPGAPLGITFSYPYEEMRVTRAYGETGEFSEVVGDLYTPFEPGVYTYRVETWWSDKDTIVYYFKVRVQDMETKQQ